MRLGAGRRQIPQLHRFHEHRGHARPVGGQHTTVHNRARCHDDQERGVFDHAVEALFGIFGIEGHVRATRLQDAQHGDKQFKRTFEANADEGVTTDTFTPQA